MFMEMKLATKSARVKPARTWQRGTCFAESESAKPGMGQGNLRHDLNHSKRPVRTSMPGGVARVRPTKVVLYADYIQ
jgi:hypothetical protein